MNDSQLIFLVSQPRTGSTLLQTMLNGHPKIDTAPEPWLLLHPLCARRPDAMTARFNHELCQRAVEEFLERLPEGAKAHDEAVRAFALSLYSKALTREGNRFLDKTPRYYMILDDLLRVFPRAAIIVLFRNPLAVLLSVIETWCPDLKRVAARFEMDLLEAPQALLRACESAPERVCAVQYEALTQRSEETLTRVCDAIGVAFEPSMMEYSTHRLPPSIVGDPRAIAQKDRPEARDADAWTSAVTSRERAAMCLSYLHQLGEETVARMGYDALALREEVSRLAAKGLPGERSVRRTLRGWRRSVREGLQARRERRARLSRWGIESL